MYMHDLWNFLFFPLYPAILGDGIKLKLKQCFIYSVKCKLMYKISHMYKLFSAPSPIWTDFTLAVDIVMNIPYFLPM